MPKPPTKYAIPTFRKGDMARHLREEYLNKPQIHGVRISSDLVRNHFSSVMAVYGKDPADAKQVGQVAASLRQVVDRLNKGAAITHSQRQALQPLLEFVLAGNYLTAKMCVEAGAPLGLSDYQVRYYIVSYKQKWRFGKSLNSYVDAARARAWAVADAWGGPGEVGGILQPRDERPQTISSPRVQVWHVQVLYNGRHNFVILSISVHISTGRSRQGDTSAAVSAFQVEAGSRAACPPSLSEILFAHMVQDGKGTDSGTSSSHSVRGADSTALRRRGSGKRTRTSQGGSDLLRAWIAYGNYNDAHILRREDLVTKVDDAERAQPSE
ncbi:hypothetical protein V8E36_002915 [Tilletia maclaganii]